METVNTSGADSAPVGFADMGEVTAQPAQTVTDTPVLEQTEGVIEKAGGDGVTSFDELESIEAHSKMKAKKDAKAEADKDDLVDEMKGEDKKAKDVKKEAKPKKEAKTEEKSEDKAEAKTEEPKVEAKAEESTDEESEDSDEARIIRVDSGRRKVTIRDDAKFKVTGADGTKVDVPLKELIDGHKRVLDFDTESQNFSQEKEVFLEQKQSVDDTIGEMAALIEGGNAQDALFKFFEVLGADPVEQSKALQEAFVAEAEKMSHMSPAERQAYDANKRAEIAETRLDAINQREAQQRQRATLETTVSELQTKHSIDDATFTKTAEELLTLREKGHLDQMVTPELVVQVALHDRTQETASDVLSGLDIAQDQLENSAQKVVTMLKSGLSKEDVTAWAKGKWGEKSEHTDEQTLSNKIHKNSNIDKEINKTVDPQSQDIFTSFDEIT